MSLGNPARTAPNARDPLLRGRTYAIPFDTVWETTCRLARARKRWQIVEADDYNGHLRIEATTLRKKIDDVDIRIMLDENAQTRFDMTSQSRQRFDWGRNRRRIRAFVKALDRELATGRRGTHAPS